MRQLSICLIAIATLALPASAEPVLKIINFTADWCPNCKILNPRLAEAVSSFDDGQIEIVDLDMTKAGSGSTDIQKINVASVAMRLADANQAGYLWDWYGGHTGIAAVIAADNGEPIACFTRALSAEDIQERLNLAKLLAEHAPQGRRKPDGPDCPPALRK